MYLESLYLEVTRNCTLECEHCLRGPRERVNMSPQVIDAVFKDVKKVSTLLLTGGEPLVAIQTLEYLVKVLKEKEIEVEVFSIITNGTVLSDRLVRVLRDMKGIGELSLKVSDNIFHKLQVKEKDLYQIRKKNLDGFFRNDLSYYLYGTDKDNDWNEGIYDRGNATKLTSERLKEISSIAGRRYMKVPDSHSSIARGIEIFGSRVFGPVNIDVNGNLVPCELSFEEEDKFAYEHGINITELPMSLAIASFSGANRQSRGIYFI